MEKNCKICGRNHSDGACENRRQRVLEIFPQYRTIPNLLRLTNAIVFKSNDPDKSQHLGLIQIAEEKFAAIEQDIEIHPDSENGPNYLIYNKSLKAYLPAENLSDALDIQGDNQSIITDKKFDTSRIARSNQQEYRLHFESYWIGRLQMLATYMHNILERVGTDELHDATLDMWLAMRTLENEKRSSDFSSDTKS